MWDIKCQYLRLCSLSPLHSVPSENTPVKKRSPLVHPKDYTVATGKTEDRNFNLCPYHDTDDFDIGPASISLKKVGQCLVLPLSFLPAEGWNHGTNLRASNEAT